MAQFLISTAVPEVEPYVARLRARFDPAAQRGLGAHVTLLHAHMRAASIDPSVAEKTAAALSSVASFDYQITGVSRFPGTLYLAVQPVEPFVHLQVKLIAALHMGGCEQHAEEPIIPHISVVRKSVAADLEVEAELTTMLQRHGPIPCVCRAIALLENSSGFWVSVQEFALSGDRGGFSNVAGPTFRGDGY